MGDTEKPKGYDKMKAEQIVEELRRFQIAEARELIESFCDYYDKNSLPASPPSDIVNTFLGAHFTTKKALPREK